MPGMKKTCLHIVNLVAPVFIIRSDNNDIRSCVAHPLKLPHYAAISFAIPTLVEENIKLIKYRADMNDAKQEQVKKCEKRYDAGELMMEAQ